MPKNPENPDIFRGVEAIEDAGGIDGFVREVLAEATRRATLCVQGLELIDRQFAIQVSVDAVHQVVWRRLKADINRRFKSAFAGCIERDLTEGWNESSLPRMDRAFAEVEQWADDLVAAIAVAIRTSQQ